MTASLDNAAIASILQFSLIKFFFLFVHFSRVDVFLPFLRVKANVITHARGEWWRRIRNQCLDPSLQNNVIEYGSAMV